MDLLNDAFRAIVKEENSLLLGKIKAILGNSQVVESYNKPMNFEETLEYLRCSRSYLYKLTHKRKILHSKQGKRLMFEKKNLDDFLLQNKVKTVSEIQEETEVFLNSTNKNPKF